MILIRKQRLQRKFKHRENYQYQNFDSQMYKNKYFLEVLVTLN